jgi:hypothetical protein
MKVIGMAGDNWSGQYICVITHSEIEKYLGLYYCRDESKKLKRLEIGNTVDLGKGHDYASEIQQALRKTQEFIQANQSIVNAILAGLNIQRIQEAAGEVGGDREMPAP